MKIRFASDDGLPLRIIFKIPKLIMVTKFVYQKYNQYYPQVYLQEWLYQLKIWCSMKKLIFQKEVTLIKQLHQKNVCFVIIGISKILDLNFNQMFVINVIMY